MRVFVTGASGWIGSATVAELLGAGHEVVGLARSDASAASLEGDGRPVLRGDLDDLDALRRGAADADAVAHLANKHDWANPAESNRAERTAVETLAEALAGSERPFLLAAGVAGLAQGRPGTEARPVARGRAGFPPVAGARTSPSTTSTAGSARSAPGSPRRSTVPGTTGSSPTSPPRPAATASPPTSATDRRPGRPCTAPTPPGSSGSASSRRPPDPACTPSPRMAIPPGRSRRRSDRRSTSP